MPISKADDYLHSIYFTKSKEVAFYMSGKPQFTAGQVLRTDSDIRNAMLEKEPIMVYQDLMRLRPPLPIIAYNDDIVKIADGTTFLRRVTKFYTLSDEEAAVYNSNLNK